MKHHAMSVFFVFAGLFAGITALGALELNGQHTFTLLPRVLSLAGEWSLLPWDR
jgi:hypothetical protein